MEMVCRGNPVFRPDPFWGTYAQWFEKDLLYAEMTVLQAVYLMSVLKRRNVAGKMRRD